MLKSTSSEKGIGSQQQGLHRPHGLFMKNLKPTQGTKHCSSYKIYWTTNLIDYVVKTNSLKDLLNSYRLNLYPQNTYWLWGIYCMNTIVIGEPKILYCKRRSVKENISWWGIPRDIWKDEYIGWEIHIHKWFFWSSFLSKCQIRIGGHPTR